MKRIFHSFENWEDWKDGQYRQAPGDCNEYIIERAARVLSNPPLLKLCMSHVASSWKHASEQNLSNRSRNRQAWLGQASCSWIVGASEDMTKAAWHRLSLAEQQAANAVADEVIHEWEVNNAKN